MLPARLERGGAVLAALPDGGASDREVRDGREGDQDQSDVQLVYALDRVYEGLYGLHHDDGPGGHDHGSLYGGRDDLYLPVTEGMVLVRRLRGEVQRIHPDACGDDVDYRLGGVREDRDGPGQPVCEVLDDQKGESQDHYDLLELEVVVRRARHERQEKLDGYRDFLLKMPKPYRYLDDMDTVSRAGQ